MYGAKKNTQRKVKHVQLDVTGEENISDIKLWF